MNVSSLPLRQLIFPAPLRRAGNAKHPVLSMTMRDGLVDQTDKFKKRVASTDTSQYKVVDRNQLVVGFPIDEGVLSFQRRYDAAIVSPAYDIWNLKRPDLINCIYLERFLRSPMALKFYGTKLRGTAARRRTLPDDIFLSLQVPVLPLEEQGRITEVLDRAEALRANRRAALAQLDSLSEALFLELFGDIRKHKLVPLESLASNKRHALSSGPFGSSLTSKHYVDEGILVLRGTNVTAGDITLHDCKFVSESKAIELSRSLISPMDIVIVAVGASGFACLIPKDFPAAVMSQNFNKISPNLDLVDPKYLVFLLNSSFVQRQFFQNITDTVRTFLSLTKIRKISVPLPPIELQREFARRVRAVEKLKTAQRASLAELDALFASLQHRAFRGEL